MQNVSLLVVIVAVALATAGRATSARPTTLTTTQTDEGEGMKLVIASASLVAALAVSSVALAGGTLAGKYATTIKSPAQFKGAWVLNLAKGGTYTVDNGQILIRGRYSTTGSRITFGHETGDGACAKSGTYTWKKTGKMLKFTRVRESPLCSGRSGVLAHMFTQQR
jgi:hypothetical protein